MASGNVSVQAEFPVNNKVKSVVPTDSEVVEKERLLVAIEPLTSSVVLGEVVPIPTCAFAAIAQIVHSNRIIGFFMRTDGFCNKIFSYFFETKYY